MDVRTSRETYMARAAKYVDAHVTTTDGRCGEVIATSQRRHNVIRLTVRQCRRTEPWDGKRGRLFTTDNEHATISPAHD